MPLRNKAAHLVATIRDSAAEWEMLSTEAKRSTQPRLDSVSGTLVKQHLTSEL
jgi:hypothetical protein